MNYWHMQLHPNNLSWGKERELLEKLALIGLGDWEERISQQSDFENKMQFGDVVAIKRGESLIALVEVVGEYEYKDEVKDNDLDWFERRRKVKVLDWYSPEYNFFISPRGTLTRCNISGEAESTNSIIAWHNNVKNKFLMKNFIDLLKFKHQIILQGPPGTGKTRMAKLIAEEMTSSQKIGSPLVKIDNFFKNLSPSDPKIIETRNYQKNLLKEFHQKFPISSLAQLTLEKYAIGTGTNDSFCWWIERGLKPLGYYFPGSARTYLLYWSEKFKDYSKHTKLLKDIEDNNEAMSKLAFSIYELVESEDYKKFKHTFGDSFILKIFHSYYPDKYFPINSIPCLNNVLKLLGIEYFKMNPLEKNLKVQEIFIEKKNKFNPDITNLEFMRFLFENFDLKGDFSVQSSELVSEGGYKIIQFHPAYSYEDFVRGITVEINENNQVEYKVENRILAEFAEKALNNSTANFVLIVDEINRANLPAVLGELIYALEYRYDKNDPNPRHTIVESLYALKSDIEGIENTRELKLPSNLFIIGTMNTADRSVGHIDYAIRRRFAFVDLLPDKSIITLPLAKEFFTEIENLFENHIASDFDKNNVMLGHSYFLADNNEDLKMKLKYEVLPILNEYIKDGVLNKTAETVQLLNDFAQRIEQIYE